jgi:hypothetical protein
MTSPHTPHCTHGVPVWICRTCCPETVTTTDDRPWDWTVHPEARKRRDGWLVVLAIVVLAAVAVAWRVAK